MHELSFTLPGIYLRHLADQVARMGADVHRWLSRSGLREGQLDDVSFTVSFAVFRALVRDALELTREPALGLFVGERLVLGSHGVLGYAAMSSGTVREAMELLVRYAQLRLEAVSIRAEVTPAEVRVCFEEGFPLGDVRRPLLEAVLLSIKNVLDAISLGACRVGSVSFPFERPGYSDVARELFGCEVRWGASWTGFTLPPQALDVPLRMADPAAFREAALLCQRELEKLRAGESTASRVQRLLLEGHGGFPSLQMAARRLHVTPRTLHRRLVSEGTSYRDLLEEVRRALAIEQMRSGRFSIEEIAYTLGYSDLANFRRAFKRWESVPPSVYRAAFKEQR